MLTARERQVLDLVERDPMASQAALAKTLGITRSSVAGHIRSLTRKGAIRGRGYILERDRQVVVVGGANVDLEGHGSGSLMMADSNPGSIRKTAGGVGRNIAATLARLGVPTRLHTVLGLDDDGRWLHDETADAGVDMSGVVWLPSATTARYLAIVGPEGGLALALNDMEIVDGFHPESLPVTLFRDAPAVVVDANLTPQTLGHVLDSAGDAPVFVDPVSVAKAHKILPHLGQVHLLKPNLAEAEALTGSVIGNSRHAATRAAADLVEAGARQVVISLGAGGAVWATEEGQGSIDSQEIDVVTPTGAGDALMAGLVLGHLEGRNLGDSTARAVEFAVDAVAGRDQRSGAVR